MKLKPGCEPAFPSHGTMGEVVQEGMNVRLEIASRIAAGMWANKICNTVSIFEHNRVALRMADDLIAQELATREEKEDQ